MTREELFKLHEDTCKEALELMKKKNQDYGANEDPFRNFRTFGALGFLVRMSDKLSRLRTYTERGEFSVKEESVEDTIQDLVNYSILLKGYLKDGGK